MMCPGMSKGATLTGMKAYSQDLRERIVRERIVRARVSGQGTAQVARAFEVSTSVVRRYMARHR